MKNNKLSYKILFIVMACFIFSCEKDIVETYRIIEGRILDCNNQPSTNVTVELHDRNSSCIGCTIEDILLDYTTTDEDGYYCLETNNNGGILWIILDELNYEWFEVNYSDIGEETKSYNKYNIEFNEYIISGGIEDTIHHIEDIIFPCNCVFLLFFKTNTPLQEGDTLFVDFNSRTGTSRFTYTPPQKEVPEFRVYGRVIAGNKAVTINWWVNRNNNGREHHSVVLDMFPFTRNDYTLNY